MEYRISIYILELGMGVHQMEKKTNQTAAHCKSVSPNQIAPSVHTSEDNDNGSVTSQLFKMGHYS